MNGPRFWVQQSLLLKLWFPMIATEQTAKVSLL
jgi:hypothetical protein